MLGVMNGDVNSERLLHEKFAHLRHRGEWFRLDVELEAYIASEAHSLEFGRAYLRQDQIQMQYHGRLEMMRRNALAHGRATRGHERRRSRQPRNALQLSLFET
jgi:hypothetical protein